MVQEIIEGKASSPASALAPSQGAKTAVTATPTVLHVQVDEASEGQRLDNFLIKLLKGVPKTHIYRVIRSGEVRVNRGRAAADTRLAIGDDVRVPPVRVSASPEDRDADAPAREFPVVFEDEHLLAIAKPAGVAVHGGSGVSFGVIEQLRRARPQAKFLELVHRLDKETSGLLLIAKKRAALVALQEQLRQRQTGKTYSALVMALQEQLRQRQTGKTYSALVIGAWPAATKVIDVALHKYLAGDGERRVRAVNDDHADGRRSITLVKIARPYAACTLLDVTIKTGRTHQIRVHLTHAGHAIVGDDKYGDFAANRAYARGEVARGCKFARMFLHARRLRFMHPADGTAMELEAPLPPECEALLQALTP